MGTNYDNTYRNIALLLVAFVIIISAIFCINDELKASAAVPDTITLKAGTYRFNDVLTFPYNDIEQSINFTMSVTDYAYNTGDYVVFCSSMTFQGTNHQTGIDCFIDHTDPSSEFDSSPLSINFKGVWSTSALGDGIKTVSITKDTEVVDDFGNTFIANTNYNEVNGFDAITLPYTNVEIPTDIHIMENINMDLNGFGSTTSNDNVGITALNGDTLGKLRTNDGTFILFNGIAVTSFDSRRTLSTYVYPLTDEVIATQPFTINNGLMLYVWDDTQYYQVAWYNPIDELWYVHGDYAIIVPYGHRSTQGIGTLTDGIAISLSITPNLSDDDIGYVELGGFEDTAPYDNIITVPDDDAYSTFAMFCNANYISDSEKLSWGIAQHHSGQNLGQSQQLGENILGQFLQAPVDILDSIVIYTTPGGTAVTLMGVFGALLTLSLVIIFLKLFAGG